MSRLVRLVLPIALAVALGACDGGQGGTTNGGGSDSKKPSKSPNTDQKAIQDRIDQESKVSDPPGGVKPKLDEVTLRVGDLSLKPIGRATAWQQAYDAGGRRVVVSKTSVTAIRAVDRKPLWSNESVDGHRLSWLTFKRNVGFLLGYHVDEQERFDRYDNPARIRRIDLDNGQWRKDLQIEPGEGRTVKALLTAEANQGDLAVLASLTSQDEPGGDEAPVVAYQVTCFRGDDPTPLWTKTFEAEDERGYGGVYVWGITPPRYAHSDNQHLNWLEETLIVAAEDMQPIMALNRDTGTRIWEVEKIWEYDRGFIGPSVYSHYMGRFGIEQDFDDGKETIEAAREAFNQQFSCAVIGGPVVVPLDFERGSDSHSIFVSVSKAPTRQWSGYLADCVVYELNDKGTPISMVKVPQLVSGGRFRILRDGLVWAGHNDSFVKLVPSRKQPIITMGGGGTDLITRLAWFRQTDWQPPLAWLTAGRAAQPVVFNESHAFHLPGGGYITNKGDHDYKFPIAVLDLSSGVERQLVLNVPFAGTISAPNANYSGSAATISTTRSYVLAITDLEADDSSLDVTLGMEKWSATLKFNVEDIEPDTTSTVRQKKQIRDYSSKIELLGSSKMISEELRRTGHSHDTEYVKSLLRAGADPLEKSEAGWTALMVAACYGTADIVDLLIAAGSDVNAQDGNCGGQTVLMWAARSEQQSTRKVKALLKAGADIEASTSSGHWTALMSAVTDDNIPVVELLLSNRADVNVKDKDGHGLLWHANDRGNKQMLEILRKHGARE